MRRGLLNQSVVIRTASTGRDDMGGQTATPSTLATVWAQRTDTGGQESWRGRQIASSVSAVFIIEHRTDVLPQMQVVHGSEVFEIQAVQNARQAGGGWEALELMCKRLTVK